MRSKNPFLLSLAEVIIMCCMSGADVGIPRQSDMAPIYFFWMGIRNLNIKKKYNKESNYLLS
jgi:hypothetical protein